MTLTPENKARIDEMSYATLLSHWRHGASGDPWFEGETGEYWGLRLSELRDQDPAAAVAASKAVGWDK